jgi:hypothetical protein
MLLADTRHGAVTSTPWQLKQTQNSELPHYWNGISWRFECPLPQVCTVLTCRIPSV